MQSTTTRPPFPQFLNSFKTALENVFHRREDFDQLSVQRGLPPYVLREIMACNPFSAFIPTAYGGRGGHLHEGVALVEAASYESLALALVFGINWALFLQPTAKYGQDPVRAEVLSDILAKRKMGGLMITEPDYGSDALHMQSSWHQENGHCRIRGIKHWAGLTGWGDYWLLTARRQSADKELGRDIDFFICDANQPGQQILVEEKFHNLGLYMIPYGRNLVDVSVPSNQRLIPHSTGIKMMLDLLHRSRLQFPAMAMGYLRRLLDEATRHCHDRLVGGRNLLSYDAVQARLTRLQSAVTVCSALCINTCERAGVEHDLASHGLEANAIKTTITDLMQEAAQSLLQLVGAKGYRLDHLAGRAIVDSRPFQIFEGSNDILYIQIAETLLKQMRLGKETQLFRYLSGFELTRRASERLKGLLEITLDSALPQRKLLVLGQLVSRIVVMDLVVKLGDRSFCSKRISSCLADLQQEIHRLLGDYANGQLGTLIDPGEPAPSWRDCYVPS
jgi:alkylation response protein AidB-like acyl-CoA dehydrogenase